MTFDLREGSIPVFGDTPRADFLGTEACAETEDRARPAAC
jgi:hypothetical protein